MRRTKEDAEATRNDVLRAALQVFSEKGYAAATLEDIADRAGVTRGAIYWHFDNKADLYNQSLEEFSKLSSQIVARAIEAGGSMPAILKRIFVDLLHAVEHNRELRAALELELFNTGRIPELVEGRQKQLAAGEQLLVGMAQAMEQGIAAGSLREDIRPLTLARSFLAFQNGVIQLWLLEPGSFSLASEAEAMAEIYLNGIIIVGKEVG